MTAPIRGSVAWARLPRRLMLSTLVAASVLAGCSDDSTKPPAPPVVEPPVQKPTDVVFAPSTGPEATVRRTTGGVPHIKANDLQSAAFALGYLQAQDNLCLLADGFLRARGERAKYLGPGPNNAHVISDFSLKAQRIRSGALADLSAMDNPSRAMIYGFTQGYNKYVRETSPANYPAECRNQPWVFQIEPEDYVAHLRVLAQVASGGLFATGAVYAAVPPGVSPNPIPVASALSVPTGLEALGAETTRFAMESARKTNFADLGLASNAWGVGSTMTENGKGALLANPHFPYTGIRRFYESQITVPNYVNFHGAGLLGSPLPQIGFNQNLGWSHTVSASRRFTMYELKLKSGNDLVYVKDGVEKPITQEVIRIQVATGAPTPTTLQRTFYYSEYGPMLAANLVTNGGLPAWGAAGTAYTYRDANADAGGLLSTWLQMSRATNLEELKNVFRNCGSTLWVNTTYADDKGNAYYIDSSSVPNLSAQAIGVVNAKRQASAAYAALFNSGLTLLDGSTSRDDWVEGQCKGRVPFDQKPQLTRNDFVQNSNDSYWATNSRAPLEGYSPLFGPERTAQGPRTRIGLYMLLNPSAKGFAATPPAGQDGKFSAQDLIRVIWNNRAWYAEEFLPELRSRCDLIGTNPVNLAGGGSRRVDSACAVLKSWNGVYDADSVGAHVFRVFIVDYRNKFATDLTKPFDPANPVTTPSTPKPADPANLANDPMLTSLAAGLQRLDQGGIAYNARLGAVQVYQASGGVPPGGTPVLQGASFPWHGGDGTLDGAFNAVRFVDSSVQEDTRIPRINATTISSTAGLSAKAGEGWNIAYGTSWHFGLDFTDSGPRAYGLLSYSESSNAASPYYNDQQRRYADKEPRQIWFTEADIAANVLPNGTTTIKGP